MTSELVRHSRTQLVCFSQSPIPNPRYHNRMHASFDDRHVHKKRFGQHFLHDAGILRRIVQDRKSVV